MACPIVVRDIMENILPEDIPFSLSCNADHDFPKSDDKPEPDNYRTIYRTHIIGRLNKIMDFNSGNKRDLAEQKDKDELDKIKPLFEKLDRLLKLLWKKYECKLKVHTYDADVERNFVYTEAGIKGVDINIDEDKKFQVDPYEEGSIGWLLGSHHFFHEFFHNIDYAANPTYDEFFSSTYRNNIFGETIEKEVYKLRDEENDKNKKATEKRLNNLTYRTPKRYKAVLYDIIGGVLNRGRYGCYPANSRYYCNKNAEYYDRVNERCENSLECDPKINKNCNEIFGHGSDYWNEGDFQSTLAQETFAHMAASAIVNPIAYKNITKCLKKSEEIFREILKEMLCETSEECREWWGFNDRK